MSEKLIQQVVNKITKKAYVTNKQAVDIEFFLNSTSSPQMTYQQMAKFLAPKVAASEQDVYFFLLNRDKVYTTERNRID